MRQPALYICENKGADQYRRLFRSIDSTINPTFQACGPLLWLYGSGLCRFSCDAAHLLFRRCTTIAYPVLKAVAYYSFFISETILKNLKLMNGLYPFSRQSKVYNHTLDSQVICLLSFVRVFRSQAKTVEQVIY